MLASALRRWVMLDVFLLALLVFIVESANAVPSVVAPGAAALVVAVVFGWLASWWTRRLSRAPVTPV